MALESGTYINSLNASNPASTDGLGQADDHLRLIKGAIKNTFPNLDAAVTSSPTELNVLDGITATTAELNHTDGVTSAIQTQLDAKASSTSPTISNPTFTGATTAATATLTGTTTVTTVALGSYTVSEGADGRLDFKFGATTVMSLDTSGNLRVRGDVSGFDTTA
jgi:hypothetical protein